MAVEVREFAPAADVGGLVEDSDHGCFEASAAGVDGEFFGRFHRGHGQGGDQGPAVPLPSLERLYSVPLDRTNLAGSNCGRLSTGPWGG